MKKAIVLEHLQEVISFLCSDNEKSNALEIAYEFIEDNYEPVRRGDQFFSELERYDAFVIDDVNGPDQFIKIDATCALCINCDPPKQEPFSAGVPVIKFESVESMISVM